MQRKILEFANILRKSGIRVSTAEAIDTFNALDELSIEDREIFQSAEAIRIFGQKGVGRTFDDFLSMVHPHDRERVRVEAAITLGEIGEAAKTSLPALKEAAQDKSPAVRAAAEDAIKKIG